jgi:hypothetical protein
MSSPARTKHNTTGPAAFHVTESDSYPHSAAGSGVATSEAHPSWILRPVRWSGPRAPFDGLAHEPRRHGVQLACVLLPRRSGGSGGFHPVLRSHQHSRRANERRLYGVLDRQSVKRSALQPSCRVQSSRPGAPQSLDRRLRWRSAAWATEAEENISVKPINVLPAVGSAPYRSLSIRGIRRSVKALLTAGVVGAGGVEPPASSVSAKRREPLC